MKAGLVVIAIGLAIAGLSTVQWWRSDATLSEEILSLDDSRANLRSSFGTGAYRIDLERLQPGDRVLVRFEFRDELNGSASIWEREHVVDDPAPHPAGALATASGSEGDVNFTVEREAEYALVVESPEKAPSGKVRITWDPPVETGRNPVYLGAARATLVLTVGAGALLIAASVVRKRRGLS